MKRVLCLLLVLVLSQSSIIRLHAGEPGSKTKVASERCADLERDEYPLCSTEKINHQDCEVVIDRRYPVTWPTIQMKPGKHVRVVVRNPLDFETLSLDETSFSLLPGTDQLASLLPSLIPQLKGLGGSSVSIPQELVVSQPPPPPPGPNPPTAEQQRAADREQDLMDLIRKQTDVMRSLLATAKKGMEEKSDLFDHARAIYEQLNQTSAPLPKPGSKQQKHFNPPPHAPNTPDPWTNYSNWRYFLLCEMVGGSVDQRPCPAKDDPESLPPFVDILGTISGVQAQLPSSSSNSQPANALFDQTTFDGLAKTVTSEVPKLTVEGDRSLVVDLLNKLEQAETELMARLSVLSTTLGNIQKDFLTYYQNILLATDAVPVPHSGSNGNESVIGTIFDPSDPKCGKASPYANFLGRQVVYAVNTVNNVAVSEASIVATSSKTSLSTVTVLYADPRFETSAGALVSFVHNRSFVNQTISNAGSGSPYANGEILITQTKTDPELVPFVAAHWRIGNEFLIPGQRRGAVYGTIWGGLNPYVNVPDYGVGPTLSWRSMMVSVLYNRAHQTSLITGEYQNEPVCGPTPTGSPVALPPCTGTPPAPVTRTTAVNAFAIGISVRIPTSFTTGGGVSR